MQLQLKLQLSDSGTMVHYELSSPYGTTQGTAHAEPNLNMRLGESVSNHLQVMCNQVLEASKRRKKGR